MIINNFILEEIRELIRDNRPKSFQSIDETLGGNIAESLMGWRDSAATPLETEYLSHYLNTTGAIHASDTVRSAVEFLANESIDRASVSKFELILIKSLFSTQPSNSSRKLYLKWAETICNRQSDVTAVLFAIYAAALADLDPQTTKVIMQLLKKHPDAQKLLDTNLVGAIIERIEQTAAAMNIANATLSKDWLSVISGKPAAVAA